MFTHRIRKILFTDYPEGLAYDSTKGEIVVADYPATFFSPISDKNNAVRTVKYEMLSQVIRL
jgi:DNA-binding beta-propeller fold protein YncE